MTQWVTFAFAAVLVTLVAYLGYIGYEGSRQLTDAPSPTRDCRTPATLGWEYEAINYDVGGDAVLASEADPTACTARGPAAGDAVAAADGVGLAGWYVPAADGAPPDAPTIVLAHGWSSNKSAMLERAAVLHRAYNLVLFDFRNHGQSGESATTQGVRESGDLVAILDWLEASKGPDEVVVYGVSMGGASALAAAVRDDRIDALIVEATHATLANAIRARLDAAGYPLSLPGSWAVMLGTLVRTGEDASAVDPMQAIEHLDGRPVLLVYGGADGSIGPTDGEQVRAAGAEAGTDVEFHVCESAGHGGTPAACPEEFAGWVLGFLERVIADPG